MQRTLVFDQHQEIATWVSTGIFGKDCIFDTNAKAIGIMVDGRQSCGVVYSNFIEGINDQPFSMDVSIFAVDKLWATRQTLYALFAYPFIQLRLKRLQTVNSIHNEGAISVCSRLGFVKEGYHRDGWITGGDAFSWSMLPYECPWIKNKLAG